MRLWITALLTSLIALPTWAGQFKNIKDVEVHYSAFNSTFLSAKVAKQYQLKRNGYSAILNISILDTSALGKPATTAKISGTARNLVGNTRTLNFREIKEGDAIYYIAEFPITHEENITFNIDVDSGLKGAGPLRFNQKFYVEE